MGGFNATKLGGVFYVEFLEVWKLEGSASDPPQIGEIWDA